MKNPPPRPSRAVPTWLKSIITPMKEKMKELDARLTQVELHIPANMVPDPQSEFFEHRVRAAEVRQENDDLKKMVESLRQSYTRTINDLKKAADETGAFYLESVIQRTKLTQENDDLRKRSPVTWEVPLPTHVCIVCYALWIMFKDEDGEDRAWSLWSSSCGPCCDNVHMGEQIKRVRPTARI